MLSADQSQEPDFTPEEEIQILWSTYYGKIDLLQKIAARKVQRPEHEVDRIKREAAFFKRLHDDCVAMQGRAG